MPLNEISPDRIFRGLKCAYTGRPVTVRVVAAGKGMPVYFSPDAFDPMTDSFPSSEALFAALSQRGGVTGAASGGNELVCPYTGAHMTIVRTPAGFSASGGFSPAKPLADKVAFARAMLTRGGVLPESAPQPARVSAGDPIPPETRAPDKTSADDYALEHAEAALRNVVKRRTTVSMSKGKPKKAK